VKSQENPRCLARAYKESFLEPQFFGDIRVVEPCNYVSSVAYYHATTRLCDFPGWSTSPEMIVAQKRAMALLAAGSSFMHASHTFVGYTLDNKMISLVAYLAYQNMISALHTDSSVVIDLSDRPKTKSGI
jgi:hypothetical protein